MQLRQCLKQSRVENSELREGNEALKLQLLHVKQDEQHCHDHMRQLLQNFEDDNCDPIVPLSSSSDLKTSELSSGDETGVSDAICDNRLDHAKNTGDVNIPPEGRQNSPRTFKQGNSGNSDFYMTYVASESLDKGSTDSLRKLLKQSLNPLDPASDAVEPSEDIACPRVQSSDELNESNAFHDFGDDCEYDAPPHESANCHEASIARNEPKENVLVEGSSEYPLASETIETSAAVDPNDGKSYASVLRSASPVISGTAAADPPVGSKNQLEPHAKSASFYVAFFKKNSMGVKAVEASPYVPYRGKEKHIKYNTCRINSRRNKTRFEGDLVVWPRVADGVGGWRRCTGFEFYDGAYLPFVPIQVVLRYQSHNGTTYPFEGRVRLSMATIVFEKLLNLLDAACQFGKKELSDCWARADHCGARTWIYATLHPDCVADGHAVGWKRTQTVADALHSAKADICGAGFISTIIEKQNYESALELQFGIHKFMLTSGISPKN